MYQLPVYKMLALGSFKLFWSSKRCGLSSSQWLDLYACMTPPQPRAPSPPPSPAHTPTMSDKTFNILHCNSNGIGNKRRNYASSLRRTMSKWWPFRSPSSRHYGHHLHRKTPQLTQADSQQFQPSVHHF